MKRRPAQSLAEHWQDEVYACRTIPCPSCTCGTVEHYGAHGLIGTRCERCDGHEEIDASCERCGHVTAINAEGFCERCVARLAKVAEQWTECHGDPLRRAAA